MRWSEEQYEAHKNRLVATTVPTATRTRDRMNKLEGRYCDHLALLKAAGEIEAYAYEPIKLRLAKATYYTPDFLVVKNNEIHLHEVKGFWRDDARVKIKVAASRFPWWRFVAVQWHKGLWEEEWF